MVAANNDALIWT